MTDQRADPESEAKLVEISLTLATLLEEHIGPWVARSIEQRAAEGGQVSPALLADAERAATEATAVVGGRIRELLTTDIDHQMSTPLALVRSAISYPTAVLAEHGVTAPDRPVFETDAFPDDIYALSPANFADIHPDLRVPGLEWGAAKAFVHLKRRAS